MEPFHDLPPRIELDREEYRAQHNALETALQLLNRFPEIDPEHTFRVVIDAALRTLLGRIWPLLGDMDDEQEPPWR